MQSPNPISDYKYGFHKPENYAFKSKKGLSKEVVEEISYHKNEPEWMRKFRLEALDIYYSKAIPQWGGDLNHIPFDNITYYISPTDRKVNSWKDLPKDIKDTYDRIGIPEAEKKFLGGVSAQYESEVVYKSIQKTLSAKGVIFLDMDSGLRQYPDLVKKYFGTIIPPIDNKFSALNSAVWSGGSFIYVPKGVRVELPLQAYFRINAANMGQFERTLIIADEGSFVHYVEGCTAPIYTTDSLHSAVVEIIVKKGARVRYTTIQNWSNNVYNLVTKRMRVEEEAVGEWVDGNLGCLSADTVIFTNPHGPATIKTVKPGDIIYGIDLNSFKAVKDKVVAVLPTGRKLLYHLITENYREIKATQNHPFLVLSKNSNTNFYTLSWQPLSKLRKGSYIAIQNGLPEDGISKVFTYHYPAVKHSKLKHSIQLPKRSSEDLLWLLGLYLGDGFIEKSKNKRVRRVYFAIPKIDRARPKLIKVLQDLFQTKWSEKGLCVTINSSKLADFILSLGFDGSAKGKRIPSWIWSLPIGERISFIRGYFDSDGYLRKVKKINSEQYGQIIFASANRDLLEQMKNLMIGTGLNPLKISTYVKERKLYKGKLKLYISYYLSLNARGNLKILLGEKRTEAKIEFVRVKEIKKLNTETVYDIQTEKIHNFLANGIVVHNSKLTMKYPSVYLVGKGARGEILSVAYAGCGQHQDAGGKAIHVAPYTTSKITSKSVSSQAGRTTYRGLIQVLPSAQFAKTKVVCDALLVDDSSRSDTYPTMDIRHNNVQIEHEATVSKIGDDQLFYLLSRGLKKTDAEAMIVNGFIEPIVKELPLEYAVELNRLIQMEMEGSVG